jgi:TolB-like protein/class 3 adenylate cyclase/Tfp pilus assembly protein PilF
MAEPPPDLQLEIAHVLFIDIVGYSKLFINEQHELLQELNQIVRSTDAFQAADTAGKLIRVPTGDGMALVFSTTPDAPVQCALQINQTLRSHPELQVRMGVHSGPVSGLTDVDDRSNVAGAGINMAQRVMDCGDAGHILLSRRVAEDLEQYRQWRPHLHDLGECEVKHGMRVHVFNLYTDEIGNSQFPEKLKKGGRGKFPSAIGGPVSASFWKFASIVLMLLLAAGLAIGFWSFLHQPTSKSTMTGRTEPTPVGAKRIAVLPFKSVTPANRDEILELGMADTLIAKLSNSREIIVSSLNSVRKYAGLDQDSVAAGRELRVNSVLEGNVQKVGDRIRISARLINVADGSSLWADTFDQKFTDVFAVQDAISQKVADALALRLSGEEKSRLTKRYTENVEAYQLYLTGRYHWSRATPSDIRKGIGFLQQAIELDPHYALAYAGLAAANRALAMNADVPAKDCLPQAKAAATKAIELDDSVAEAHSALSFGLIWYDWDWAAAEKEAKRALASDPNSAMAHFAYSHILSDQGHHQEAIIEIARARELEPVFLLIRAIEGMILHHAGRNEEALTRLQKVLELDPNFWVTHLFLGKVYTQQRKYPEAIAEFTKARELSRGNSEAIGSIGYVEGLAGDKEKARAVLEELKTLSNQRYIPPSNVGLVYNGLGNQNEALASLERACDERDARVTLLKVDPRWDSLRSDPRFIAILKRIGLQ